MTIDLLDAPLRVTWDLHGPSGALNPAAAQRVADELLSAGVFFVTLQERPLLHPAFPDLIGTLAGGGVRTFVVCDGGERELERLRPALPVATLFLDAQPFISSHLDAAALEVAVGRIRERGYDPALLLTPLRTNIAALPALLDFCREQRVGRFKLPNVKINGSFWRSVRPPLLRPEDVEKLRLLLDTDGHRQGAAETALEIHDLFLWEVLSPEREDGRSEYGGCQAGNSLAHVDASGDLFPCSSWPQRLGSLLRHSLEDLWCSPERLRVRDAIAAVPSGCAGCRDYPLCFGGCRGLARTLGGDGEGRDPLCAGPRR